MHPAWQQRDAAKTSMDFDARTAEEIIKQNFPDITSKVVFPEKGNGHNRIIYFTKSQQEAILCNDDRVIIRGVPGSGKSLILMMQIFIAAQDKTRKKISIMVVTAMRHLSDYQEFLSANMSANAAAMQRGLDYTSVAENYTRLSELVSRQPQDFFCDEVYPEQIPAYFDVMQHKACLVLSSVFEKQHNRDEVANRWQCHIVELKTHFRGTRQIARFWQKYYCRCDGSTLTVGHQFDGITPETYKFDHIEKCIISMAERIERLNDVEGCTRKDFAILFENLAELSAVAERLNPKNFEVSLNDNALPIEDIASSLTKRLNRKTYEFYVNRGALPVDIQIPPSAINSMIETWKKEFEKCFKSALSDAERLQSDFIGYTLIVLEMGNIDFCTEKVREEINAYFSDFLHELELLLNDANRIQEWEWQNGKTVKRITEMIWQLKLLKKLLDLSSFECWEINMIELFLPTIITNASDILARSQRVYDAYDEMTKYFENFRPNNVFRADGEYDAVILDKGSLPTFSQYSSKLIESLIEDWQQEFNECFGSPAGSNTEPTADLFWFHGLALILLEARTWQCCDGRLCEEIDRLFAAIVITLECLLDETTLSDTAACASVQGSEHAERSKTITITLAELRALKKLLESSLLQCSALIDLPARTWCEHILPKRIANAVAILRDGRAQTGMHLTLASYFRQFRLVNEWPLMLEYKDLPSMQFPIAIVFYVSNVQAASDSDHEFNDFLSVSLSRSDKILLKAPQMAMQKLARSWSGNQEGWIVFRRVREGSNY